MLLAGGGQRLPSKINMYVKDFHQIQIIKVSSIIKQDKKNSQDSAKIPIQLCIHMPETL